MSDHTVVVSSWLNRRNVAWLAPIGQPECATSISCPCLTASAASARIGDRLADGCTREDDDPAQVDPQQEDRQRRQRAVDHLVRRYLCEVPTERVLGTFQRRRGQRAGDNRRHYADMPRRNALVKHGESRRGEQERQRLGNLVAERP